MDFAQDFRLVADIAVGQETNEAQASRIVREVQGGFNPFDHHGAAFAVEGLEIREAAATVLGCGEERPGTERRGFIRETDELKGVERLQTMQGALDRCLGLFQLLAPHAAGAIEHKDQFQCLAAERVQFLRRIKHQGEVTAAIVAISEQARFDPFTGDAVTQDEILVEDERLRNHVRRESVGRRELVVAVDGEGDAVFLNAAGEDAQRPVARVRGIGRPERRLALWRRHRQLDEGAEACLVDVVVHLDNRSPVAALRLEMERRGQAAGEVADERVPVGAVGMNRPDRPVQRVAQSLVLQRAEHDPAILQDHRM